MSQRKRPAPIRRFDAAAKVTRSLTRAVLELVAAHYSRGYGSGGDIDALHRLIKTALDLPTDGQLTMVEVLKGSRELRDTIAMAASAEARKYMPKEHWKTPLEVASRRDPVSDCVSLFEEYKREAIKIGMKPPTKSAVIAEVAAHHGMERETLKKGWERRRR